MSVMHSNQQVLLTILQVLLYDPLYAWTMSPIKAYQLQQSQKRGVDLDVTLDSSAIELEEFDHKRGLLIGCCWRTSHAFCVHVDFYILVTIDCFLSWASA